MRCLFYTSVRCSRRREAVDSAQSARGSAADFGLRNSMHTNHHRLSALTQRYLARVGKSLAARLRLADRPGTACVLPVRLVFALSL